ncbi:stage IV sporulation protein A [Eubacteriales bacterium OttesenSCG-928-M02]|nr:stage IV sporulation protein A [Eubacteriales bacterium OttesenSCG-928-M02]
MHMYDIYGDIAKRTKGDIYVGVVGPVRTGKSTFIKRFMELMVLPKLEEPYLKERVTDEMPQSGAGRTIMTTQPNFVPNEAVELELEGGGYAKVRLVDCVGYMVEGAVGHLEDDSARMVRTPWLDYDIPFEEAAEIGTKKVISEHSTIGVVVTTDGTIADIDRENYVKSEERVIKELKDLGKPFVAVLNSAYPQGEGAVSLARELSDKYQVPVLPLNVMEMSAEMLSDLLKTVLYEFPLREVKVSVPDWVLALSDGNWLMESIMENVRDAATKMEKVSDYQHMVEALSENEYMEAPRAGKLELGIGRAEVLADPKKELFYEILGDECGYAIEGDYHLVSIIKELVAAKMEYDRVKDALESVRQTGYGMVSPTMDELELEEPEIVRQGSRYGVKLKASAPSLHFLRVDIETEVSPIVGSEKQSEELLNYLLAEFEGDPAEIWNTNIFGKSLNDLVKEGLSNKLTRMPDEIQNKVQLTLQRVINEGRHNLITIVF